MFRGNTIRQCKRGIRLNTGLQCVFENNFIGVLGGFAPVDVVTVPCGVLVVYSVGDIVKGNTLIREIGASTNYPPCGLYSYGNVQVSMLDNVVDDALTNCVYSAQSCLQRANKTTSGNQPIAGFGIEGVGAPDIGTLDLPCTTIVPNADTADLSVADPTKHQFEGVVVVSFDNGTTSEHVVLPYPGAFPGRQVKLVTWKKAGVNGTVSLSVNPLGSVFWNGNLQTGTSTNINLYPSTTNGTAWYTELVSDGVWWLVR